MSDHPTLIMAPLRGLTDDALREAFARHFGGFDRAVAPFLTPMARGGPRQVEIDRIGRAACDPGLPAIPQLLSSDAGEMVAVIERLADVGCKEVNWNLGCPHKPVVRRGRGAGLLPHPERIAAILDQVLAASPVPLSIKMRLGREHPDESLAVLEVLERFPLVDVTIHARLATQMYSGVVDLEAFARCLAASRHPVVYNGDLVDLEGYRALQARFPAVSGWMIGRGALLDPGLPAAIRGEPLSDRAARLRRFHEELYEDARRRFSGPGHVLGRMKGIWVYLGRAAGLEGRPLRRLLKATTLARYEELVGEALG